MEACVISHPRPFSDELSLFNSDLVIISGKIGDTHHMVVGVGMLVPSAVSRLLPDCIVTI
jgi:hypothetical protein